nr:ATP-binding protein [Deinococcota bacterium]
IQQFAPEVSSEQILKTAFTVTVMGGFVYVVYLLMHAVGMVPEESAQRRRVTKRKSLNPLRRRAQAQREKNAWNWVILPGGAKEELQVLQGILKNPKAYQKQWGQEPPLGMILYGPSGTGKTLIARTLAQASGYNFLAPSPAELKSLWLGESEKHIRELYHEARSSAPCIVFLDEVDAFAAQRSATGSDAGGALRVENSATNQLLQEIDGFRRSKLVFTVAATNRLDILDRALTSRLSYQVYVGLPDTEAREKLFYLYSHPYHKRLKYSLTDLARASQGFSGRDIKTLCSLAAMTAHGKNKTEVTYEEFAVAFARLNRDLGPAGGKTNVRYDKKRCPLCDGKRPDCPGCLGSGWMDVVLTN